MTLHGPYHVVELSTTTNADPAEDTALSKAASLSMSTTCMDKPLFCLVVLMGARLVVPRNVVENTIVLDNTARTNVKLSYTKDMMKSADSFEKFQKTLTKTTKKKDREASSKALEGMAEALQTYRTVAGLTGPDGGGNIPSVDEIRRSACRVQGRHFF